MSGWSERPRPGDQRAAGERARIDAAAAGDAGAFGLLYAQHVERVYRHAYYLSGNQTDAEDLTRMAFARAQRALTPYRQTIAPFIAWLLTITREAAAERDAAAAQLPSGGRASGDAADLELPPWIHWRDSGGRQPPRHDRARVRRAILRLEQAAQQVVLLRCVEGFSCREVALTLDATEESVRATQHRALVDLARLLAQREDA